MKATRLRVCWFLTAAVAGTAMAGCARDHVRAPARIDEDCLPSEEYPQIAVLGGLNGWVAAGHVVEEPGPPLKVTVPIRALTNDDDDADKDLRIQYRFFFLDEKSVPLDRDPDWHYMQMPPRTQVFMQANALDSNALSWRLEIRPAR